MAYLTIAELQAASTIEEITGATDGDQANLQKLLNYATALIDAYVGYSFLDLVDDTIYVDGEGTNKIALHKRIYEITSVATTDGYTYSKAGLKITGKNKRILNLNENFQDGVDNIVVTGKFGWETVPEEVLLCAVLLCEGNVEYLSDVDKLTQSMGPFKSEKIGNYSYDLKNKVNSVNGDEIDTTGNDRVDLILDKYRDDGFFIGVV